MISAIDVRGLGLAPRVLDRQVERREERGESGIAMTADRALSESSVKVARASPSATVRLRSRIK